MNDPRDRTGFAVLQFMRLSGIAFVLAGAAMLAGKIHLPPVIGAGFLVLGAIEGLVLPALLAKRWRSGG
ncbi:MAG: hypothetical protein KGK11_14865 [Sphingomonadales bacterium]|nr:hypothetical protein [Sphingomonadales bacterium]